MEENKPTLWDKTTKMLVGATAVVVMFFGAKFMSGNSTNDKQSDNTEQVKSEQPEKQDSKKVYNSHRFSKLRFLRESREEVLKKYNSEKIKEVKEKSEKMQEIKKGTFQESANAKKINIKTASLTNVKMSSSEMEL
ncbi:MAG: hypothetical protein II830_02695 [Alphaproteobacteria bacterium]|nr:hypothetical protein [Alphaproteobacteria bacterium]